MSIHPTYQYSTKCQCGAVRLEVNLTLSPAQLTPRACDCDFCTARKVAYVSDPKGSFKISGNTEQLQQGSNQAHFHCCGVCGDMMAVTAEFAEGDCLGAINARLFADKQLFAPAQTASPKSLDAQSKRQRWQTLWMPVQFSRTQG